MNPAGFSSTTIRSSELISSLVVELSPERHSTLSGSSFHTPDELAVVQIHLMRTCTNLSDNPHSSHSPHSLTPQMKERYATRRPYADWLKVNTVSIGEVVATAPSAMAPQLLGVPAVSTVHPDPKAPTTNTYSSANG